jgi:hypothetical protein
MKTMYKTLLGIAGLLAIGGASVVAYAQSPGTKPAAVVKPAVKKVIKKPLAVKKPVAKKPLVKAMAKK